MLADRRQSVAEVDRDLRGGRTPYLEIAISRSRAGGVVEEDLVRRVYLGGHRIGRPARHDEKQPGTDRAEQPAARRGAHTRNAWTGHPAALVNEPIDDEKTNRDREEDLVTVVGAYSPALGRRGQRTYRPQSVREALRGRLAVIAEILPAAVGGDLGESRLVEPTRDLRAVRVDEHLLEEALRVIDRDGAALRGADPQREHVDVPREIEIERRQIGRGVLAVRDDHDRLCAPVRALLGRELHGRPLERGLQRRARVRPKAVTGCIERRPHEPRVRGERIPKNARAREERDADSAAGELLAEGLDRALRDVQAIGPDVLDGHALRYVERDDRVERRRGSTPRHLPDLGPDQREYDEKASATDEDQLGDLPRRAR